MHPLLFSLLAKLLYMEKKVIRLVSCALLILQQHTTTATPTTLR